MLPGRVIKRETPGLLARRQTLMLRPRGHFGSISPSATVLISYSFSPSLLSPYKGPAWPMAFKTASYGAHACSLAGLPLCRAGTEHLSGLIPAWHGLAEVSLWEVRN